MYAVIFRAEIKELDESYSEMAEIMRSLAIDKYGCSEFSAVIEGKQEIAVSYWKNKELINQWKQDAQHLVAQDLGRSKWYKSYQVQVVEIIREYSENT